MKWGLKTGPAEEHHQHHKDSFSSVHFSSVQLLSHVWLFVTPWTAARQASLSIANSQSLLKLMSIKSVMPSSHLILCCPLLLLPSIFPSITVYSLKTRLSMTVNNHIPLYIWSGQKSVLELAGIFGNGIAAPCEMKRLKELSFLSGGFSPTLARFIRLVSFPYR